MIDDIDCVAVLPIDCDEDDRARFAALVAEGDEVAGAVLLTNIADARILIMLRQDGIVRGVAALKRPRASYRKKIAKSAATALPEAEMPFELGYIYIEPDLQGRGLSHRLIAAALEHCDGTKIFATVRTDNQPMRSALARAGFADAGRSYPGRNGQPLGVLIRPSV
jgi:RimJ/RimL family protein N-acetyltransferase